MKKVQLKKYITNLEVARAKYIQKYGKEPQIWALRPSDGEIELCTNIRKASGGFGQTCSDHMGFHVLPRVNDL